MKRIILITGGQRSGKSSCAERMALSLSPNPIYLATAHVWDDEFRERVRKHQLRRGPEWTNIEEGRFLSRVDVVGRVVLVDCCTLWATNFFASHGMDDHHLPDADAVLSEICSEYDRFTMQDATYIFVTNEIGCGGVSPNPLQRRFADIMGWFNQYVAQSADEVYLMVSGIQMKIK